jgi:hypothetical protein
MRVDDSATAKIALEEMHHDQFGARRNVHDGLFVFDFGVLPSAGLAHGLGPIHLGMKLLQTLLSQCIQAGFIIFQGGNQCIFVRIRV